MTRSKCYNHLRCLVRAIFGVCVPSSQCSGDEGALYPSTVYLWSPYWCFTTIPPFQISKKVVIFYKVVVLCASNAKIVTQLHIHKLQNLSKNGMFDFFFVILCSKSWTISGSWTSVSPRSMERENMIVSFVVQELIHHNILWRVPKMSGRTPHYEVMGTQGYLQVFRCIGCEFS